MRNSEIWSVGLPILLGAEARMPAPERGGQGSPVLPAHASSGSTLELVGNMWIAFYFFSSELCSIPLCAPLRILSVSLLFVLSWLGEECKCF